MYIYNNYKVIAYTIYIPWVLHNILEGWRLNISVSNIVRFN